ncbi:hypothetical protein E2C01_096264 [Portunus trituberculatus]|uniref:Uncharacterized protein n=1 Tax=Portunus trituberculatus TaxID=210409 RepID=A0A5B7K2K2_PORTR|nr:hypothetical protein [Portunus trituberculatus]
MSFSQPLPSLVPCRPGHCRPAESSLPPVTSQTCIHFSPRLNFPYGHFAFLVPLSCLRHIQSQSLPVAVVAEIREALGIGLVGLAGLAELAGQHSQRRQAQHSPKA